MFSKQMADILSAARTPYDLALALKNKLGNCAQALEHRGPVTLESNQPGAVLTVNNFTTGPGSPGGNTTSYAIHVEGGTTQFDGPVIFTDLVTGAEGLLKFVIEDDYMTRGGTALATVNGVAGVTIDDSYLKLGPARVGRIGLVQASITGGVTTYYVFTLDQDRFARAIAAASITAGTAGNVNFASGSCGSESSMGITVEACSPHGDVDNGDTVSMSYDTEDDVWVIHATECA